MGLATWWRVNNPRGKIALCDKETKHAQVEGSPFCRCTRLMYAPAGMQILSVAECRAGTAAGTLPKMLEEARADN